MGFRKNRKYLREILGKRYHLLEAGNGQQTMMLLEQNPECIAVLLDISDPEIDRLQNISYETDIPGLENQVNEQGIFYCPDIAVLPQKTYESVKAQGSKSILQCAIREKKSVRAVLNIEKISMESLTDATHICWNREDACLITCREIPGRDGR